MKYPGNTWVSSCRALGLGYWITVEFVKGSKRVPFKQNNRMLTPNTSWSCEHTVFAQIGLKSLIPTYLRLQWGRWNTHPIQLDDSQQGKNKNIYNHNIIKYWKNIWKIYPLHQIQHVLMHMSQNGGDNAILHNLTHHSPIFFSPNHITQASTPVQSQNPGILPPILR